MSNNKMAPAESGPRRIDDVEFHVGDSCVLSADAINSSNKSYQEMHIDGDDRVCVVTAVGSNYVEVTWPNIYLNEHRPIVNKSHIRLHTDKLHLLKPISRSEVDAYLADVSQTAMKRISTLTALAEEMVNGQLPSADTRGDSSGTGALIAMNQCPSPKVAREGLEAVRDAGLPDLYKKIGIAIGQTRMAMEFQLLLMTASVRPMEDMISVVETKLFTIELYAGVYENVRHIQSGEPAPADEKLHVFQRMVYMDEESLIDYQSGGMDFESVEKWDEWLASPEHLSRIMPFPRTMMIARIRRDPKEREAHTLAERFVKIGREIADKSTFIYIRNGDNLYRIETAINFESRAFPDPESISMTEEMVFEIFASEVRSVKPRRVHEAEVAAGQYPLGKYHDLNPSSVYFDDAMAFLKSEMDAFRRFGLILQGLFDRSDILKPCRPVKLWDDSSFASAVSLVLDSDRTLHHGDKPDFEAYRAELNSQATDDSVFIGQRDYWMRQEAKKENERQRADYRIRTPTIYTRFVPCDNPGPDLLAKGRLIRGAKVSFEWRRFGGRFGEKMINCHISVPMSEVLNVSAYKKGDFKRFFSDPRTRIEYLKWAPLLLEAEDRFATVDEVRVNQ